MKKFLIIGLGNIGSEYKNTRHNIGFDIIDEFCEEQKIELKSEKLGQIAKTKFKGKNIVLLKPSTYMNLSGKAVKYWMEKEKISTENILVITDDIHIEFLEIRIKKKGSDGGHNGLKSINENLNSNKYCRMRFGVGNNFSKGKQSDFVLSKWTESEKKSIDLRTQKCVEAIKSFVFAGIDNTMNSFNGKKTNTLLIK